MVRWHHGKIRSTAKSHRAVETPIGHCLGNHPRALLLCTEFDIISNPLRKMFSSKRLTAGFSLWPRPKVLLSSHTIDWPRNGNSTSKTFFILDRVPLSSTGDTDTDWYGIGADMFRANFPHRIMPPLIMPARKRSSRNRRGIRPWPPSPS